MTKTPPFWDLHLHGVAGIDFMHANNEEMVYACEHLGRHGIGFFAPTLLTTRTTLLREACSRWGKLLSRIGPSNSRRFLPTGAAIPIGLHLEGPFLNPRMAGAHPKSSLQKPDTGYTETLIRAAQNHVAIVTLAPELPGAIALIRKLARNGIRVQMGHTLATSKEALRGANAGASGITHLYNAMRTHHRDPGVLAPLQQGLVTAEIITDGVHLDTSFVIWCWRAAGSHLYAVSDGCSAIGARKKRKLTLGSLTLEHRGSAALVLGSGVLAGGATYLSAHPQTLAQSLARTNCESNHKSVLTLFYKTQQTFFPQWRQATFTWNQFDSKSLKYLGSV